MKDGKEEEGIDLEGEGVGGEGEGVTVGLREAAEEGEGGVEVDEVVGVGVDQLRPLHCRP